MDKSYVLIAGSGVTSRANLEALVEDYFYAKGKEVVLLLAFEKTPSQGQIFAAQYAKDKGKDIVIFCQEGANVTSFSSASFTNTPAPIVDALKSFSEATVMLLWDEADPNCLTALETCQSSGIKAHNLCEGLTVISNSSIEKPNSKVEKPNNEPKVEENANSLTEAQKAEIKATVLAAVDLALHNALKKA
jgi:dihydroxyacetone kinase-like predicted kinase